MHALARLTVVYLVVFALLLLAEPRMVYQPIQGAPTTPEAAGLKHFHRKTIPQAHADALVIWENNAPKAAHTILYFHGNGGGLAYHTDALRYLDAKGYHVVALGYPGYPGAPGKPTEAGIVGQAIALFDAIAKREGKPPIVWGFSLGSGIATQLAAKRDPRALILEAPFTAVVDRAAELFPMFPVRYVMRNQYRSREAIAHVNAPVFILHGDADTIIPIHHGRALFALAREPKTMKEYTGFGHLNLMDSPAYDDVLAFIRSLPRP